MGIGYSTIRKYIRTTPKDRNYVGPLHRGHVKQTEPSEVIFEIPMRCLILMTVVMVKCFALPPPLEKKSKKLIMY